MNGISLQNDGDVFERHYYLLFLKNEFPSYEKFWLKFIVPLTGRPQNIHIKSNQELASMGRGDHDICIAQLHYSIARHLFRAFDIKKSPHPIEINELTEGIVRLVGAQDVAFELLERYLKPGIYDPWLSVGGKGVKGSREARMSWQKSKNYPLQNIRNYRNHLVHGRIMPSSITNIAHFFPRIGVEEKYFDWRLITNNPKSGQIVGTDFLQSNRILENAWEQTITYIETNWANYLL